MRLAGKVPKSKNEGAKRRDTVVGQRQHHAVASPHGTVHIDGQSVVGCDKTSHGERLPGRNVLDEHGLAQQSTAGENAPSPRRLIPLLV